MDLRAIYSKTAKGQEELATRAYKLPSRVRNLLIMVDGTASGEQIVETTSILGNSADFFSLLVEEGFIAPMSSGASVSGGEAVAGAPSGELVHAVCQLVSELLGPDGDDLAMRLEKTHTLEEFAKQVGACCEVIDAALGKKKGDQFRSAVAALSA